MKNLFYRILNFILEPAYYVYWTTLIAGMCVSD